MATFNMKPWDKATVYENITPAKIGDKVKIDILDYLTGEPIKTNASGAVYTISEENGELGVTNYGDPDAWFYNEFSPLRTFAHTVRFTII